MKSTTFSTVFATAALLVSSSYGTPIVHQGQLIDLSSRQVGAVDPGTLIRAGLDAVKDIDEFSRIKSADFSLDRSWTNEVLFDGEFQGANGPTGMQVTCLDCHTAGTVSVDIWEDIFRPSLEFNFQDTSAYVLIGVNISAGENVAINLFSSQSPIGVGIPGLSVGVYFAIDLIFSLSANMVLSGGFFVDFPESASLELGIFDGGLDDSSLDGTKSGILPVTVRSAHGKFKADLRISIQAGVETDNPIFGIGAGAMLGVYANVVELIATLDSTPTCEMELEAEYNLNVGAYAKLSIDIGPSVIGATPTASTTLLSAPIITTCLMAAQTSGPISQPPILSATLTSVSGSASASVSASNSITLPASDSVTATLSTPSSVSYSASSASVSAKSDISASSSLIVAPTPTTTTSNFEMTSSQASYPVITPPVGGKPHCFSSAKAAAKAAAKARKGQRSPAQVYTITRCDVDAVNCPEGHAKQVIATSRPAAISENGRAGAASQWDDIVAGAKPIGEVVMTKLASPIVNSLAV